MKKVVLMLTVLVCCLSLLVMPAAAAENIRSGIMDSVRRKGDVNRDGVVNYNDALLVLRASIGLETFSEEDVFYADVDGNPGLNYNDALKILRASINLDKLEEEKHDHEWMEATCTTPKTCNICGTVEGSPTGHEWKDATCTDPKTCTKCKAMEGDALGHNYVDGVCSVCEKKITNTVRVVNYLKENHGQKLTAADVAEALGMDTRSVDAIFTANIQRKGYGVRVPANIVNDDGTYKEVKYLELTPAGMSWNPEEE
jgi:hypothetical protein